MSFKIKTKQNTKGTMPFVKCNVLLPENARMDYGGIAYFNLKESNAPTNDNLKLLKFGGIGSDNKTFALKNENKEWQPLNDDWNSQYIRSLSYFGIANYVWCFFCLCFEKKQTPMQK